MASRPIFVPLFEKGDVNVEIRNVEFEWSPGMAKSQKQKSIRSLHQESGFEKVLEISSKSEDPLGVALSAFNLMIKTPSGRMFSLENAFQSSKVFEQGGPYTDLLSVSAIEAKRDERLKESGKMTSFRFFEKEFPLEPKTFFYDWLYVNALNQNQDLAIQLIAFNAFTDIEFNPKKSYSCQAFSAALYCSLARSGLLNKALSSPSYFLEATRRVYSKTEKSQNTEKPEIKQKSLF